ncbi:MAG: class I SAM-dependent methyltransferase [Bdellovibrio sp.]|nr:class I SAM-dependent methyltransferase [Bdellovibrio sp.]
MQLRFQEFDDFIVFDKAYGLRTHRVSDGQLGLIDFLAQKLDMPLFVAQQLDKETSGVMVFAKSKEAAKKLNEIFDKGQSTETYFFLTDQKKTETAFTVKTHIGRTQKSLANIPGQTPNSQTDFEFVREIGAHFLWKATPKTNIPHQIRLHAAFSRIAILGDAEHKGSAYFRLALHGQKLQFTLNDVSHSFESELPPCLKENSLTGLDGLLEESFHKRHQLYKMDPDESYRLIHLENDLIRADIFADRLWVYDYTKNKMSDSDRESIEKFAAKKSLTPVIRHMPDRGQGVGGLDDDTSESQAHLNWVAQEEKVSYLLKLDSGFSPGLFLDQHESRKWVRENCFGKRVLDLFSYTGGFSVNAAKGLAKEVVSVDVSEKFIEWSKENFALNRIDESKAEFNAQEVTFFLKGAIKEDRQWDLIICDPPAFGRSKEDGIWKLENELSQMVYLIFQCLEKNGEILFSCNLDQRTREEVLEIFIKKLPEKKIEIIRMPMQSLDFELPDDLTNLTKGFIVKRLS